MNPETEKFLRSRTEIGASEMAAVMNIDRFKEPADVYDRIVALRFHNTILDADEASHDILRGRDLEPLIRRKYEEQTGRKTRSQSAADVCPYFEHLQSNPDFVVEKSPTEPSGLLECKSVRGSTYQRIAEFGLFDSWVVQAQSQLACRPTMPHVDVAIHPVDLWGTLLVVRVERHQEFISDKLLPEAERFWVEHVEPRVRPAAVVDTSDLEVPRSSASGELVEIEDEGLAAILDRYRTIMDAVKDAEETRKDLRLEIERRLGDVELASCGGLRVSNKWTSPKPRLDSAAMRMFIVENGGDLDDFKVPGKPQQRLLVRRERE